MQISANPLCAGGRQIGATSAPGFARRVTGCPRAGPWLVVKLAPCVTSHFRKSEHPKTRGQVLALLEGVRLALTRAWPMPVANSAAIVRV